MFPKELKALRQWVGFKLPGKEPINPNTGEYARSNDSTTWGTYEQAIRAVQEKGLDGVGFMFAPPYVGIDLDDCIINGSLNPFAREVILRCNSYTEFSPSRSGIHILVKSTIGSSLKKDFIEVYDKERYFTVTQKPVFPVKPIREVDLSWIEQYRDRETSAPIDINKLLTEIKTGNRNNTIFSIASSLRSRGYTPEDIFKILQPQADHLEGKERELLNICRSVSKYEPNATPQSQSVASAPPSQSFKSFVKDKKEVTWISPDMLAANSIHFIAGLNGTMKTWMTIDLAVNCANGGGIWMNRYPVRQERVLFLDQERFIGETQRRFVAVAKGLGASEDRLDANLFLRSGSYTQIDHDSSFEELKTELRKIRPTLVIVDSLATFHTKNENLRMEIQTVLERVKKIRDEFGCAFVFIHHENGHAYNREKDDEDRIPTTGDMSGSEAIPAAADITYAVRQKSEDSSTVFQTKNNLSKKQLPFVIQVIDLTKDKSKISVEAY